MLSGLVPEHSVGELIESLPGQWSQWIVGGTCQAGYSERNIALNDGSDLSVVYYGLQTPSAKYIQWGSVSDDILHFSDRSALCGFSPRMPISEVAGCPK